VAHASIGIDGIIGQETRQAPMTELAAKAEPAPTVNAEAPAKPV